jgi:hypothetical protein
MLIAKLRISLRDANIQYNSSAELETEKTRGTVLADGKVVRGLGTHFANKESQERYDRLTKESNVIRDKFNRQFLRTPIEGTFIIATKGEAKDFIAKLPRDPDIDASVIEFELGVAADGLDDKEMAEWGLRVKNQLIRVPLGRGDSVAGDGIEALETLAKCPVLSAETAQAINILIAQVRVGSMNRLDFKRNIELLDVTMDQATLAPSRNKELIV